MFTPRFFCIAACAAGLAACTVPSPPPPPVTPPEAPKKLEPKAAEAPKPPPPKVAPPPQAAPSPKVAPPPKLAPPKAAEPVAKAPAPPPKPVPPAAAPLDLRTLEQRLKETEAIGVLTKLSLKNQVDDLVDRFRGFHGGKRPPTLAELRPAFELLLMKVLSLLQDHDTALAKDIDTSRDAIWSLLADRDKFVRYVN